MVAPASLVFVRVYPPRPVAPDALEAVLDRLAADTSQIPVVFEVRRQKAPDGTDGRVSYLIGAPASCLPSLRQTLRDLLPGILFQAATVDNRPPATTAARVRIHPPALSLATDRAEDTSRAVLSALNQRLEPGEALAIQIVLGPRRPASHRRSRLRDVGTPWWRVLMGSVPDAPTSVVRQYEARFQSVGMATCVRFGVAASTGERRRELLMGLLSAFSTAKAPGTFMTMRREASSKLDGGRSPLRWEFAPAARELVGLLAWPLGDGEMPGLPPIHPRLLPVPRGARMAGESARIIGTSAVPGDPAPVGITPADNLFHLVTTGPTGSGKTTVLLHLIRADIHAHKAVAVIDPKWQLVRDIVDRAIPEQRIDDVVILDPSDTRAPGFNPLDVGDRDPDVVVDGLLAVFAAVFADGWGPRTQDITHAGLLTLARVGAMRTREGGEPFTLLDLPRLFTDAAFRRGVVGGVSNDPALAAFWSWYQGQSPAGQAAAIAAPSNKWRQYLLRPSVRRILGQPRPRFRLRDLFREKSIVLVPLNDGIIGPITAQLLGGLIVAEIWAATLERATEESPTKSPASVWVDEAQNFMHLPSSLDQALAASRSMGVAWAMAHQFRAQMPKHMLAAVDANARNKVVFRPGDPAEAAAYARMAPQLDAVDFMSLGRFEAYATVMAEAAQQPWCSLRTRDMPELTGLGDQVRAASRMRYGRDGPSPEGFSAKPPARQLPASTEVIGRKRKAGLE